MRALWESIKGVGGFIWKNADAFLVITVALGVVIAEVVGEPSQEVVDSAILGLLGVTSVVLLRDRVGRDDLDDLRLLARDAISDRPYEVVWQDNHWDLHDRDNTTIKVTERLRFTRNDVSTIAHWSRGDGEDKRNIAKWRRSEATGWIDAERIHSFPVRGGEKVIYCFEEEHNRGDMLDWCIERDAVGRFPTTHEGVELHARTNSDHPRVMAITWPADSPPNHVEIRHGSNPARTLTPTQKDGRPYVEEKIPGLAIGEVVRIDWSW
jgi:hypothetical protein